MNNTTLLYYLWLITISINTIIEYYLQRRTFSVLSKMKVKFKRGYSDMYGKVLGASTVTGTGAIVLPNTGGNVALTIAAITLLQLVAQSYCLQ